MSNRTCYQLTSPEKVNRVITTFWLDWPELQTGPARAALAGLITESSIACWDDLPDDDRKAVMSAQKEVKGWINRVRYLESAGYYVSAEAKSTPADIRAGVAKLRNSGDVDNWIEQGVRP